MEMQQKHLSGYDILYHTSIIWWRFIKKLEEDQISVTSNRLIPVVIVVV